VDRSIRNGRPSRVAGRANGWGPSLLVLAALLANGAQGPPRQGRTTEPRPGRTQIDLSFANALLSERRYEVAAEEFDKVLRAARPGSPEAADALYGLARAELFLRKYGDARQHLEQFLRVAPEHASAATARFRLGEAAYLMRDPRAAAPLLEDYLERHPGHVHNDVAWSYLGDVRLGLSDPAGARQAYEKAVHDYPDGPLADRARYHLGRLLAEQGETDRALELFASLAARTGEWADRARLQIGLAQLAAKRYDDALATFEALERSAPAGPARIEARLRRAEALAGLGQVDEAEALLAPIARDAAAPAPLAAQAGYALGDLGWERGQFDAALAAWEAALARGPAPALAPMLLVRSAEALARLGRSGDARARFLQVVERHPRDPWADRALLGAARLAFDARDYPAARTLAATFRSQYPESARRAEARLIEARAAQLDGKPAEAVTLLRAMLEDDQPGAETRQTALYYLGEALKATGRAAEAETVLAELARAPASPLAANARFALGQGHFEAGRYAEAIEALDGFLAEGENARSASAPHALAYLVLAHHALDREDDARRALDRLVHGWPDSDDLARVRLRLGEDALEARNHEDALTLLRPVAEGRSEWAARARSDLGWALVGADRPAEAAEAFATAVAADPDGPLAAEAAYMKGWALEKAGQAVEALAAYADASAHYGTTTQGVTAALARARLLARSDRPVEAAEAFAAFLDAHPDGAEPPDTADAILAEMGRAWFEAGDDARSDAAFRELLDAHSGSSHAAEARVHLAESAYHAGQLDEAETLLAPLLGEDADTVEPAHRERALFRLGRIAVDRGDTTGALRHFGRLIDESPAGALRDQARFWRAEAAFRADDARTAEPEFATLARGGDPDDPADAWRDTARLRHIQCLVALARWSDVLSESDAFLSDRPAFPQKAEVHYARGRALATQAPPRFDEARAAFQAALDATPGADLGARAQFMIGETYLHEKNWREAARAFHRVELTYRVPKWQAAALLESGKAYEALNQPDQAAASYRKLVETFTDDPNAAEARRRLERLTPR
jgi:TolA-binding protein